HSYHPQTSLFSLSFCDLRDLHSFPTRRSSDLLRIDDVVLRQADVFRGNATGLAVKLDEIGRTERRGGQEVIEGTRRRAIALVARSEEHTSELQSRENLVCRLLLEKKKTKNHTH